MKKLNRILAIILVLAALTAVCACGGDKYAKLSVDVNGIGRNMLNIARFEFKPEVMDDPAFAAEQLKLATADLNMIDGKPEIFYAVSAASPEAVFVIGARDAAAAKSISNGPIKNWIADYREGYSSYGPEQVPKLDSCVNMTAGRYVFVIVSNDNAAAKKSLTDLLDTALKING
ncbi:MAG: DUF4358 domain-containing protein [Clostridia bacterium]|nr:DUF4358 domain-containing protein [Clostridia bacterium]